MNKQLDILKEMTLLELRVQRRNPIWIISLAAAALLGFSEGFTAGVLDWPTTNQAFRAYQLGCVMIFGMMTFLLTAGSLSRDLSDGRRDLLLCRPISPWVYICGKYIGNILFVLCINVIFMASRQLSEQAHCMTCRSHTCCSRPCRNCTQGRPCTLLFHRFLSLSRSCC